MRFLPCLALVLALLLVAAPARADILELKDGRFVEGVVVESGESFIVHSRFGPTEVKADEVKRREKATSVDAQIQAHLAKLDPDDQKNRALLARWLKEIGRVDEAEALAEAVLEVDLQSAEAHKVLGHVRHQGVWRTPDEAKRAEGLEKHGGRWYTPAEWANVKGDARAKAVEAEKKLWQQSVSNQVNRAVKLMLSPDLRLRARGRATLETLAKEYENERLTDLVRHVDAYVKNLDEVRERHVAAAAAGTTVPGATSGMLLAEVRATFSRLKRPIKEFETSLASNIGGAPVKIQLPELEVINIRTMVGMPAVVR